MNKLWSRLGIITYWLIWPGLWLMLRWSHRTRLLLVCNGEFLALRGWLGNGEWGLPGGGLHHNEIPIDGLLRELKEETGVVLIPNQVSYAFNDFAIQRGLKFHYHAFTCEVPKKPAVRRQHHEIAAYGWQPLNNPAVTLNQDTKALLEWWLNKA